MAEQRGLYDESTVSGTHKNPQGVLPGMHQYKLEIEKTPYQKPEEQSTPRTQKDIGQLFGLFS